MLDKDSLHHAYILEGDRQFVFDELCDFCEKELEFKTKANPDFWHEATDRFSVSDARRLREMQSKKTLDNGKKIFIISFNFITREAQNALLKVLEEPTAGTYIFIITPTSHIFLDTVLSRVSVVKGKSESETLIDPRKFLKDSYADRIDAVTKLVKKIKDEKASKADAILFVKNLQSIVYKDAGSNKANFKNLKKLMEIEDYMQDTSSSVKMLLEEVALLA